MQNHCKDEQNKQDSQNMDGPGAHYHHSYCVIISL